MLSVTLRKCVDMSASVPNSYNNNNNNQDEIYGAVIMAKPLREFTRFIWWMQTQRRGGRQPSDQANRLGMWVRQKEMAATVHIHHHHLLLLSPRADTHFTVPRRVEGWVKLGSTTLQVTKCECECIYLVLNSRQVNGSWTKQRQQMTRWVSSNEFGLRDLHSTLYTSSSLIINQLHEGVTALA